MMEIQNDPVYIAEITDERIRFDNGDEITYSHDQNCCEWNYADFKSIDSCAADTAFTLPLKFEPVGESGFRFGNEGKMFFIPCYSVQNGYYTRDIDIYFYDHKHRIESLVLSMEAEWIDG